MESPQCYAFWFESAPSDQLIPIYWETNKRSSPCLPNISETTDQSSLRIAAHLYLVYASAYQKLADLMQIRLKYIIQEKLYIQYSKKTHSDPEKIILLVAYL